VRVASPTTLATAILGSVLMLVGVAAAAAPGDLDPTFGGFAGSLSGRVLTDLGGETDEVFAVAIQPDGRIVATGSAQGNLPVVRYNTNGSLDPTFGAGGKVIMSSTGGAGGSGVVLQPDGKIVVGGYAGDTFTVFRYTTSGSLDSSFGSGGRAKATFASGAASGATAVALQPDGKIVAAGITAIPGSVKVALARYKADGSLDKSFNGVGTVTTAVGSGYSIGRALAIQPDGRIVVAVDTPSAMAVVRYLVDGSLDAGFGAGGIALLTFPERARAFAIALQPDAKLIVAGVAETSPGPGSAFRILRLKPNGSLDTSFGTGGKVTTAFGGSSFSIALALALQPDGMIVAAGTARVFGTSAFGVARYQPNGTLDASFGSGGTVITSFFVIGGLLQDADAIALQPDGKIVVAGRAQATGFTMDFALARYLATGPSGSPLIIVPPPDFIWKTGTVTAVLLCRGPSACFGTLFVEPVGRHCATHPQARRACELGEQSFRIAAGKRATVRVALNPRGRVIARRYPGGRATLTAQAGTSSTSVAVGFKGQSFLAGSCPQPVALGRPLTFVGKLTPAARGTSVTVAFIAPSGGANTRAAGVAADGSFSASFVSAQAGTWSIRARWRGDRGRFGAQSQPCAAYVIAPAAIPPPPPPPPPPPAPPPTQSPSSITMNCPSSWQAGSPFPISGSVDPPDANVTVKLKYESPQGDKTTRTPTTISNGTYSDSSVTPSPNQLGTWTVKASWEGDAAHTGSDTSCSIHVV
jgi:uncharacterized delta-60 repeat protein